MGSCGWEVYIYWGGVGVLVSGYFDFLVLYFWLMCIFCEDGYWEYLVIIS